MPPPCPYLYGCMQAHGDPQNIRNIPPGTCARRTTNEALFNRMKRLDTHMTPIGDYFQKLNTKLNKKWRE